MHDTITAMNVSTLVLQATPFAAREEGSGHAATVDWLPQQIVAVTSDICAVWSSNYVTCFAYM